MALRRQTPLSFTQSQIDFVAEVFVKSDVGRIRQTRVPAKQFTPPIECQRDFFLKDAIEQLTWLTSSDGKDELNEKEQDITSSAASMITNILHFAAAAGAAPLEVLEKAMAGFTNQLGSDAEYRLVWEFLEQMLDVAGKKVNS